MADLDTSEKNNLFNIPAGLHFADTLVQHLMDISNQDMLALSRILVLLPSRRACRTVRDAFLRYSNGDPIVLPRLQPLGDIDADELNVAFAATHADAPDIPPAISALERQTLLARMIMMLNTSTLPTDQTYRYDQALQLAAELSRLLDQVQTERVSFDALQDLVPKESEYAKHWQITLQFLTILTENWPNILEEMHMVDPAVRRNRLLEAQAALWREHPPSGPVIAAGTIASVPATLDILEVISKLPQGQIVLPGLDRHLDDQDWEAITPDHPQYFVKKLLSRIDGTREKVRDLADTGQNHACSRFWSEVMRPAKTTPKWRNLNGTDASERNEWTENALEGLSLIECRTPQREAEAIALIMREALETPDKTVALVSPDRHLARRVTGALERWGIQVDDSAGLPLHHTVKGAFVLSAGQMAAQEYAPVEFLKTMKHPLARLGFDSRHMTDALTRMEQLALRGIRPAPGIAGLKQRLLETEKFGEDDFVWELTDALNACTPNMETAEFSTHIENHLRFVETLAATTETSGAARLWADEDGEALALFFNELMQIKSNIPPLDFPSYLLVIRQLLSQKTVRPKYGTHPRAFILGQIESRMTSADTLILAGLNEGLWPSDIPHDPWMSRQMRADFGLPAAEQQIGIAAHDFVQLASGPRVFLTRALRDSGGPTVPSRWILRMNTVLEAAGLNLSRQRERDLDHWLNRMDAPDAFQPISRPAPIPPVASRPKQLSVSGIERLMRDPYEVYARYILGLKALDPLDADPAAAERGQLIHEILERFVSQYPAALPPNAERELKTIGKKYFADSHIPPEIESFWWPRFERLIGEYIGLEREWRENNRPEKTEVKGRYEIQLGQGPFTVTAIADRIDRDKKGAMAIIDYKTGAPPAKKDIEAGFSPQLWLEALIARYGGFEGLDAGPVHYLGHWVISGGSGVKMNEELKSTDFEGDIRTTEDGLRGLIDTFYTDGTPYLCRPNSNALPRYSDYTHLERVSEWVYDNDIDEQEVGK